MQKNNSKSDFSELEILVLSCDKYSDLWSPFAYFFNTNWPDCKYRVSLVTNHIDYNNGLIGSITIGDDKSWSDNLIKVLGIIKSKYVFLLLDDMFLKERINQLSFESIFKHLIELKGHYVKLIPNPKPKKIKNDIFGYLPKGSLYRTTAVSAIWKTDTLLDLLKSGENAWQFEYYGSVRADKYDGFYVLFKPQMSFIHGVIGGSWLSISLRKMSKKGYDIQSIKRESQRSIINQYWSYKYFRRIIVGSLFRFLIPDRYKRRIRFLFLQGV